MAAQFINIEPAAVAQTIADQINDLTAMRPILLLLSGGSAIEMQVKLGQSLNNKSAITLSLCDERFGPVGHPDSNWQKLEQAGFDFAGFKDVYPVLKGADLNNTTSDFNAFLQKQLEQKHYLLGIFGMGEDGHTSGVLPGSPAVSAPDFAVNYKADDFIRITTTPAFIAKMNEAYVYAYGAAKQTQIARFAHQQVALSEQPLQVMKQLNKVTFFSDYKGE